MPARASLRASAEDPSLLVAYELLGSGRFVRRVLDAASGVGRGFAVVDLDGNLLPDVVVSNKNGLFVTNQR